MKKEKPLSCWSGYQTSFKNTYAVTLTLFVKANTKKNAKQFIATSLIKGTGFMGDYIISVEEIDDK